MYPSRTELQQLGESVRFSLVQSPHHIRSSPTCDHLDPCECGLTFICPLCPFESDSLSLTEVHYDSTHWTNRLPVGSKYVLFPCGLMHATARQSLVSRLANGGLIGTHYHCPLCSTTGGTKELILQHIGVTHPSLLSASTELHSSIPSIAVFTESVVDRRFGTDIGNTAVSGKLKFNPMVRVREFPLALSIVEQQGGRSETKKPPTSFDSYVSTHELAGMTQIDIEIIGCNRQTLKLFKDCCFLVCGIDVAPHTISAIHSLGGRVHGAHYLASEELLRTTHVLLGERVGPKPVKALRRTLAASPVPIDSIQWVGSDWVRERVERGSMLGLQKVFSPSLMERFFTMKEASARSERRRTMRNKADMGVELLTTSEQPTDHVSRRPSPVLEPVEMSFQFRSTPEASPVPTGIVIPQNENNIPLLSTPLASPSPQAVAPVVLPPLPATNRPRRTSLTSTKPPVAAAVVSSHPPPDATPLRRSKRSAVIVSPGKFSHIPHHPIKKD